MPSTTRWKLSTMKKEENSMPKRDPEWRIQANIMIPKKSYQAFRRFVREGGWTMTGWIRRQVFNAANEQLAKESGDGEG